jgi:hypothetical protein
MTLKEEDEVEIIRKTRNIEDEKERGEKEK